MSSYDDPVTAELAKTTATIADFKAQIETRLENIEAKGRRPGYPGETTGASSPEEKTRLAAFERYLRTGDKSEVKALAEGTNSGADGGYAVPKVIDSMIAAVAVAQSPIRSIANVIQVLTPQYHILVNKRGWGSGWVGETDARIATTTAQMADVQPTFGEIYSYPQTSQQLMDDAFFNVQSWLANEIGVEFGRAESDAFINGDGTDKPTGFLHGTPVTTGDSTRAFGVLQYIPSGAAGDWVAAPNSADVLLKLIFSLRVAYRKGACFVMHPTLLMDVMGMKDSYGRFIFQPAMSEGAPATLWGYPIVEAEHMPAKAANSFSVAFGNFQAGYTIADRIGTRVIVDPFSNKPYVGVYASKRVGGCLVDSNAIKLLKFAAT